MPKPVPDLNRRQFERQLRALGFRPCGSTGWWRLPAPLAHVRISERNGADRLRSRIAYMLSRLDQISAQATTDHG